MREMSKVIYWCVLLFFASSVIVMGACKSSALVVIEEDEQPIVEVPVVEDKVFVHPGVLHTMDDITRMRRIVANKEFPGYAAYEILAETSTAQANYFMRGPFPYLSSQSAYGNTRASIANDFGAAYQNAFMWVLTQNSAHAEKAKEILLAYSGPDGLKEVPDVQDGALLTGSVWAYVYAAEMLRYTYDGFTAEHVEQVKGLLTNVFKVAMENLFYKRDPGANGNWGAHITCGYMAMAIFLDDSKMYNFAKEFYLKGRDNGSVKYYLDDSGQCQESGRDIPHPQFGISNLAYTCEMAYKQGDDLYSAYNNRLLKGYEYTAKYALGYDVPFRTWGDVTGKYSRWNTIATFERGRLDEIFEVVYNHYVVRKGLDMPYTKQALMMNRPEAGPNGTVNPYFGSLTFYEGPALEDTNVGFYEDTFKFWTRNWWGTTTGVDTDHGDGKLKVTISNGSQRGDIRKENVTLHAGNFPLLAVKINLPSTGLLVLDSQYGHYNSSGNATGKIGNNIYYYDIAANPFGSFYIPKDRGLRLNRLQFKVTNVTTNAYTVDWIKTFRSLEELEQYAVNN